MEAYRQAAAQDSWVPLGRILIREGILSVRRVLELITMQAGEAHVRLGGRAVREGDCTRAQIERRLAIQAELSPGPIQLVLRDKDSVKDRLLKALAGYIHDREGRLEASEASEAPTVRVVEDVIGARAPS